MRDKDGRADSCAGGSLGGARLMLLRRLDAHEVGYLQRRNRNRRHGNAAPRYGISHVSVDPYEPEAGGSGF